MSLKKRQIRLGHTSSLSINFSRYQFVLSKSVWFSQRIKKAILTTFELFYKVSYYNIFTVFSN